MTYQIPEVPGVYSHMALGMHFARWADHLTHIPTCSMVMERFGVHRATAYRWIRAYRDCPKAGIPAIERRSA